MDFMISRKRDYTRLGAAVGAALMATLLMLPQAKGELVYEDEESSTGGDAAVVVPAESRDEARGTLRQALGVSRKAQVTLESAPVQVSVVKAAPAQASNEVENVTKSELMRRQRVREELKNEDILQERLEELRLRDERRRTDELLGVKSEEIAPIPAPAASMQSEVISAPVTEKPGQQVVASAVVTDQMIMSKSAPVSVTGEMATTGPQDGMLDKVTFTVAPRGGIATMANTTGFDVRPRYSAGLGLGMGVSDHLSFETSYTFSEYGVAMNAMNGFAMGYNAMSGYGYNNFETQAMRQHLFDAGLKLHFLGPETRIRPFIGGGGAYSLSFLNYDSRYLSQMSPYMLQVYGRDYQVNSFLGYLSTGLDVRVTKSISISAMAKYYAVLSARENNTFNPAAMYSPYGWNNMYSPMAYMASYADQEKMQVGGSLARTGFFVIQGGVTFSF